MWSILVRFRHQECGLIGDISKAYYQIHTGETEKHVRRVLWRDGEVGTPWRIYGFQVVSMGDNPAATFMELTKKKTTVKAKHIDKVAAKKIDKDSFVDDISTGGTEEECKRFKGKEDPVSLVCDGTMPQILSEGGLDVKAMAQSGEKDGAALHKFGVAVLGLGFSRETDLLKVRFKVNVSDFKKGSASGPALRFLL